MINMNKIGWQNGTLVSKAKVEIGGIIYEVEPEEYSGATPLSAENLIQMETNTENAINEVDTKHSRHIVTAYSSAVTTNITSENQVVVLDGNRAVGSNKLIVENNSIKIGANVSKVLISAQLYYQDYSASVDYLYPNITINGNVVGRSVVSTSSDAASYQAVNISPFLIGVSQGDIIKLTTGQVHPTNRGSYRGVQGNNVNTYITVEVVE